MEDWKLIALPGRKLKDDGRNILFQDFEDSKVWLPKSKVFKTEINDKGGFVTVTIPRWLAEERGLT
jgi:hypothetical protein